MQASPDNIGAGPDGFGVKRHENLAFSEGGALSAMPGWARLLDKFYERADSLPR
jgi:hypothetical protein